MNGKELKEIFDKLKDSLICPRCDGKVISITGDDKEKEYNCNLCHLYSNFYDDGIGAASYVQITFPGEYNCYWDLVDGVAEFNVYKYGDSASGAIISQNNDIIDIKVSLDDLKKILMLV